MRDEHEFLIPNTDLENPQNIDKTGKLVLEKNDYNLPGQEETRPEDSNDPPIPLEKTPVNADRKLHLNHSQSSPITAKKVG
jgi:hypothetical protein